MAKSPGKFNLTPSKFDPTNPTAKRSRDLNNENIEFNGTSYQQLVEQIKQERENSNALNIRLESMQNELSKLTSTIDNLNKLIKDLQDEKNQMKKLYLLTGNANNANIEQSNNDISMDESLFDKTLTPNVNGESHTPQHTNNGQTNVTIMQSADKNATEISTALNGECSNNNIENKASSAVIEKNQEKNDESETVSNNKSHSTSKKTTKNQTTKISIGLFGDKVNDSEIITVTNNSNTHEIQQNEHTEYIENETVKRTNKVPPVVVWAENIQTAQNAIRDAMPKFSCVFAKINKTSFRVLPKDANIRKKVLLFLEQRGYHFNTYTPADEKMQTLLIKGSEIDDENVILHALKQHNITPFKVQRFSTGYMRANNKTSNFWQVTLQPNTDIKHVLEVRYIQEWAIKWEFLKKQTVIQCKRCQRFDHSAGNCSLPYRCVKCTNNHAPGECPMNLSENTSKPKCINCNGEHAANNASACPKFKKAIETKKKNQANNESTVSRIAKNITSNKPISYASSLKQTNSKSKKNNSANKNNAKINSNISVIELVKCLDENQKAMAAMMKSLMNMQKSMSGLITQNGQP